jgi:carboxypeptidase Taq
MAKKKNAYDQLWDLSKTIALYASINSLLQWDQETYMPQGAIEFRSLQITALTGYTHKIHTSTRFTHLLSQLVDIESGELIDTSLSPRQIASLREWRRDHLKAMKLPLSFVKTFSNVCSKAIHAWSKAKKENSFKQFAPHLEKIVTLCRKKADILGFHEHPYDALLDLYEPEMKVSMLTPLFSRLKVELTELLKKIDAKPPVKADFIQEDFPKDKQLEFAHTLLRAMGFDETTSRLDLAVHPFCSGLHPKDTRMTTRIHSNLPMSNIFAVLHEGGHGLYNMDLPQNDWGSPIGEQSSLGIDESQSRWWETLIGHSLPFWKHFYPKLQKLFPHQLQSVTLDNFYRAINIVKPSFIRIEADEVTYCLHIILRFEIEKGLIEGTVNVKDVPDLWREKMRASFAISPEHDDAGCLQDIHWSMGAIGYFPTYALGNLYAAQFFSTFQKAHPDWKEKVSAGELAFIHTWLKENIHCHGREFTPHDLITRVTGQPLSEKFYISYLQDKCKNLSTF